MENTPRCRACGFGLKSTNGCSFCLEMKSMLIWPIIDEQHLDGEFSASTVIKTTLRSLKRRLKRLDREIGVEEEYDTKLTKDLSSISKALRELASEQRKLENREEEHYAALGIEGRMQLFISEFFVNLPEEFQKKLLGGMQKIYISQNESQKLPDILDASFDGELNEL